MDTSIINQISGSDFLQLMKSEISKSFQNELNSFDNKNKDTTKTKLFTVNEVLSILKISKPTLYKLFNENELIPCKIRRRTFIHHKELERYLEKLNLHIN